MAIGAGLIAALQAVGGAELGKWALSTAGRTLIAHLEQRTGITVDKPEFDAAAGDYVRANREEMNQFKLAMRQADSEDLKREIEDRQHAREQPLTQTLIGLAWVIVIAAVVSVVGTLAVLLITPIIKPGVKYPEASMILITAIVNFMLGGVLGAVVQYLWGTSRSIDSKNATIREALQQKAPAPERPLTPERPAEPAARPEVYFDDVPAPLSDERPMR